MFKFEYVAYGLLAITALFVIVNLIKGLIRGLKKTIGSLVAIVLSALIAAIVTAFVCTPNSSLMLMIIDFINNNLDMTELGALFAVEEIGEVMLYYVTMIIAPFFFMAVYAVLSIIIAIVVSIVTKFIPPLGKQRGVAHRLGGLGVGVACGIVASLIMLMPVVGALDLAVSAGEVLMNDSETAEAAENGDFDIAGLVSEAKENAVFNVYRASSGWMFNSLASASFEGERVYLKNDVVTIVGFVPAFSGLEGEGLELGEEQIDALNGVIDGLDGSALLKYTVSGIVSEMAERWNAGESFMGIEKISMGELLDPMMDSMISVFATSTRETISEDLRTVTAVLGVLVDHDMMSGLDDYDKMLQKFGKEGVIGELIVTVNRNERMSVISDEITKISVRALATTLKVPEDADELYDGIIEELVVVLNDSRYSEQNRVDVVAASVVTTFENNGMEITDEQAHLVAESLVLDLGNVADLNGNDVEAFFLVYSASVPNADAAVTSNGSVFSNLSSGNSITINSDGTISIGGRVIDPKIYSKDTYALSAAFGLGSSGKDIGDAAYLYSADKTAEVSSMVTMEGILAHMRKYSECQDPEAEAQKISEMFAAAAELFADGAFDNKSHDELITDMGKLLDKMRVTEIFGAEARSDIMKAIMQSETVKDEMGLTVKEASTFSDKLNNLVSDEYTYADATNTVSNTITMIDSVKDDNITKEERRENTQKLIEDLDPSKADMLSSMVTPSSMVKYGSSEEKANTVANSVSDLFNNMANFNAEEGSDAYKHEADAVNTVLDLAMKGADDGDERRLFGTDGAGKLDTNADDFVHLIVNSEVVSSTILSTASTGEQNPYGIYPSDEDREELSTAMEAYYAENSQGKTDEEIADLQARLNALAIVTDMPVLFPAQ